MSQPPHTYRTLIGGAQWNSHLDCYSQVGPHNATNPRYAHKGTSFRACREGGFGGPPQVTYKTPTEPPAGEDTADG